MFMNTIAVPFFGPVLCVTGATDALPLLHCALYAERAGVAVAVDVIRPAARVKGVRIAIGKFSREKKGTSVKRMCEENSCDLTADFNNAESSANDRSPKA